MRAHLTEIAVKALQPKDTQFVVWDSSFPGFGIRIGKRRKTWVKKDGTTLVTLGHFPKLSLKDARAKARDATAAHPYKDTVKTYLAQIQVNGATHDQYEHYLEVLDFKSLDITKADIKEKLAKLDGKPVAQNMAYASLRAFLNWCVRNELIEKHPLIIPLTPNKLQSRERVLSDDELKAIWHACSGTFGQIVKCLILSGQRRMEIKNVLPEHITDVLTIPQTKNKQPHVIPLTPMLKENLTVPFKFNDWSRMKERFDRRCGVKDWTLHDLRRTFSTNQAKLGTEVHVIERLLNHRSGTISGIVRTYNRYGYLDEMRVAMERYEAFIQTFIAVPFTPK
jgi:integrase